MESISDIGNLHYNNNFIKYIFSKECDFDETITLDVLNWRKTYDLLASSKIYDYAAKNKFESIMHYAIRHGVHQITEKTSYEESIIFQRRISEYLTYCIDKPDKQDKFVKDILIDFINNVKIAYDKNYSKSFQTFFLIYKDEICNMLAEGSLYLKELAFVYKMDYFCREYNEYDEYDEINDGLFFYIMDWNEKSGFILNDKTVLEIYFIYYAFNYIHVDEANNYESVKRALKLPYNESLVFNIKKNCLNKAISLMDSKKDNCDELLVKKEELSKLISESIKSINILEELSNNIDRNLFLRETKKTVSYLYEIIEEVLHENTLNYDVYYSKDNEIEYKFAKESELRKLGYYTGESKISRLNILKSKAIPKLGKRNVIKFLNYLIETRENQRDGSIRFKNAISIWKDDLQEVIRDFPSLD